MRNFMFLWLFAFVATPGLIYPLGFGLLDVEDLVKGVEKEVKKPKETYSGYWDELKRRFTLKSFYKRVLYTLFHSFLVTLVFLRLNQLYPSVFVNKCPVPNSQV